VSDEAALPRSESVQVAERVAHVLRLLGAGSSGLTLAEFTARTGLPRTTTHRLVHALIEQGFVDGAPPARLELRRELAPVMERLSHGLGETIDLAVLDGGEALFGEQYPSPRALRVVSGVGARFPLRLGQDPAGGACPRPERQPQT
jgi:IclR family acetate operon transcriptional repressor